MPLLYVPSSTLTPEQNLLLREVGELCLKVKSILTTLPIESREREEIILSFFGIDPKRFNKPGEFKDNSVASYYNIKYASWLAKILDLIALSTDSLPAINCAHYSCKVASMRMRIVQSWRYLMEHPNEFDSPKYIQYFQTYRFKSQGEILRLIKVDDVNARGHGEKPTLDGVGLMKDFTEAYPEEAKKLKKGIHKPRDFVEQKRSLEMFIENSTEGEEWISAQGFVFSQEQMAQLVDSLEDVLDTYVVLSDDMTCLKVLHCSESAKIINREKAK